MKTAQFIGEVLKVSNHQQIDNHYWLEIPISGWDEVKTHTNKIVLFEGREYGWSCWNSDRMVSVFRSPPWPSATLASNQ